MNGLTKLVLWSGIALVFFESGIPNEIMIGLGLTNSRFARSPNVVALGLCLIVGALAYWRGYDNGHREGELSRNRDENLN
jgi:hypothetical protein